MAFKMSTYAESSATQAPVETAAPIIETPVVETTKVETPVVEEKKPEISQTVIDKKGGIKNTAVEITKPVEESATVVETPIEENTSNFSIPDFNTKPTEEKKSGEPITELNWKDALKKADVKEVLKELGLDEFEINLHEHRKRGGKTEDYINAKGIDYSKVSDRDMVLQSLQREYPNLEADDVKELFEDTYKQGDNYDEDDKRRGSIRMKAEAYKIRQSAIERQQQFKITDVAKNTNEIDTVQQQQLAQQRAEQTYKFFTEHEATQNLIKSKRVAINLGEGTKPFNFNVDKPEALVKPMLDSESWQRVIAVNPEEPDKSKLIPDVAKLQRLILQAMNPNYEKDIYNAGKSAGEKGLVDEGKNAVRPITKPSIPNKETFKEAWKNRAKVSTYGTPTN